MTALIVNDFTVLQHPQFQKQYEALLNAVIDAKSKDPVNYKSSKPVKILAAINKIISEIIPSNPASPDFNQGKALGDGAKHWKRVVFFQQYRLFFRYDLRAKVIILGWVNDETTLRAYESKTDAYRVFKKMLQKGNPPNSWRELLAEANEAPKLGPILKNAEKSG